jgi:hypothetical protein
MAMNRTEIDTFIAQMEVEKARLQAKLPLDSAIPFVVRQEAEAAVGRVDKILNHPGLEVLKEGADNYERLPIDQKSQISQLYTLWIANAKETLKTLHMLSEAAC